MATTVADGVGVGEPAAGVAVGLEVGEAEGPFPDPEVPLEVVVLLAEVPEPLVPLAEELPALPAVVEPLAEAEVPVTEAMTAAEATKGVF